MLFKNSLTQGMSWQNTMYDFTENQLLNGIFVLLVVTDAVFCENTEPRSLQDKQKRAKQTFEEMMRYIPGSTFMTYISFLILQSST